MPKSSHKKKKKKKRVLTQNLQILHVKNQITGEPVGEVRAVSGMHQRKAEMARQADAFIALPGFYLYLHITFFWV